MLDGFLVIPTKYFIILAFHIWLCHSYNEGQELAVQIFLEHLPHTGVFLDFPNHEVIDNILSSVREQLLERGTFPGTTSAHINPSMAEDFFPELGGFSPKTMVCWPRSRLEMDGFCCLVCCEHFALLQPGGVMADCSLYILNGTGN